MDNNAGTVDMLIHEVRALEQSMRAVGSSLLTQHIQVEAYASLLAFLKPSFPFPPMGSYSISPDLALLFATYILERRATLLLETGSGISTIVAGYCLAQIGRGRIISLEHDAKYAAETARLIRLHRLEQYVQLFHSPLVEADICGDSWVWYDRSFLNSLPTGSISIALIDGPPGDVQKLSRYPALPLLQEFFKEDAVIIVDDAKRPDEAQMLKKWIGEYPLSESAYVETEKGASVLTFRRPPRGSIEAS